MSCFPRVFLRNLDLSKPIVEVNQQEILINLLLKHSGTLDIMDILG